MKGIVRRTPAISLKEVFLHAAAGLATEDSRAGVVGEALGYLQEGFQNHYAATNGATDEDVLVGDNAYASAVQIIAYLDEPRFVAVASRMIRDGSGRIAAGREVSLELWTPHLAGLLDIISGEGLQRSELRIRQAAEEVRGRGE
jgi:hypothetical protein